MSQPDELAQRLEKAKQNLEHLGKIHDRRQFELEQSLITLKECTLKGKELGVSTPEELLELIEKTEKEDRIALEEFEASIRRAGEQLRAIEQQAAEGS